ncbi:MAG TPA: phosphate ABC transporter substrate-binding protein [Ignavibacteriales bacterium]|nr:phosphate ABC transporter substrate-binding protein [Ignavibacteriales bacterium]HOL81412.1 phosphate ABC transporter substrate-binding protein [Ignavibacteriales bacterium]HOM65526.1 phosphate ABC transporter substrate-binding protein [Ignavibacteriales bacterium]HPP34358.1 phosphate ABC transporter substrate-binding protein [Ignavibacteriales bacterium]HRR18547.1 phosphate ABC transporter substrate-binding protein [Ignavibacteriales bacterium]
MKKVLAVVLVMLLALAFVTDNTVITVKGSDTMVILAQRWAEKYMKKNPNVTIQVTGGGSGTGISALINGTTDICNSSRPMKASEKEKLKQRYGTLGVEIRAAKDGLAVYVNEKNKVKDLTLDQVYKIYTGKITNWKEVGGDDAKIIVYGRENNSGTYVYFKDFVLKGQDYVATMQSMPGTAAVVNAVAKDKNAIGYGGAAYGKGIKFAKIDGYEPTAENVKAGKYPITRFLYMYVRTKPSGAIKNYIDWILSPEGQEVVTKVGYFPVK